MAKNIAMATFLCACVLLVVGDDQIGVLGAVEESPQPVQIKPSTNVVVLGEGELLVQAIKQVTRGAEDLVGRARRELGDNQEAPQNDVAGSDTNTDTDTETLVQKTVETVNVLASHVEIETNKPKYKLYTIDGDLTLGLIKSENMDGAILVVSAVEGPSQRTREDIVTAYEFGINYVVGFIDKIHMVDDPEQRELVEREVRDLLTTVGYLREGMAIAHGSAELAIEPEPNPEGVRSIHDLLYAMDWLIPAPVAKPFLMPVEDVFSITGRGTVATGRIERGIVTWGKEVDIVGLNKDLKTTVIGIETFQKQLDEGKPGDNVGVLLEDVAEIDIAPGMVVAAPGSITAHTKFETQMYVRTKEEDGRHTPFFKGYRPEFYIHTTYFMGAVTLPVGVEMVSPGDNVKLTVDLITPVAMERGLRITMHEGDRTVGEGVITAMLGHAGADGESSSSSQMAEEVETGRELVP